MKSNPVEKYISHVKLGGRDYYYLQFSKKSEKFKGHYPFTEEGLKNARRSIDLALIRIGEEPRYLKTNKLIKNH